MKSCGPVWLPVLSACTRSIFTCRAIMFEVTTSRLWSVPAEYPVRLPTVLRHSHRFVSVVCRMSRGLQPATTYERSPRRSGVFPIWRLCLALLFAHHAFAQIQITPV